MPKATVAALAVSLILVAAAPGGAGTQADHCVSLTVYYRVGTGPNDYVLGPDHCAVGTPWSEAIREDREVGAPGVVTVGVGVGVPLP